MMPIPNGTHRVAEQALKDLFDYHIELGLRAVLPFTRTQPGPWQLNIAGGTIPIDRITSAVRAEVAQLIDHDMMTRDVELMIRAMGLADGRRLR